ncbi:MAG TPA: hypothetical protein VF070_20940 [Streptosporangiaceae bacterium]
MGLTIRRRSTRTVVALAVANLAIVAVGTSLAVTHHSAQAGSTGPGSTGPGSAAPRAHALTPGGQSVVFKPAGPHGGVNLNVLVVTDGSPPVEAIRSELNGEGLPVTVLDLRNHSRQTITRGFLVRTWHTKSGPVRAGNFEGIVLPSAGPSGLSATELTLLAKYERLFGVREVDAYTPPMADVGMTSPVYSGPLSGPATVTSAGASAGFGYLNATFPFSGGIAGQAPFGYLANPLPGSTPLVNVAIPGSGSGGTLVWQDDDSGRQRMGIGFGYGSYAFQFRYLAHGVVTWLTHGVNLGYYRNYLDIAYDDMFLGDAQWSMTGHCTPGDTPPCPPGTPNTPGIRMVPADVTYAVQWEKQHGFKIEFLYNGGLSSQDEVNGVDPLLAAVKPVANDFYWVNHTWTHAYMGCVQDFTVSPWKCVTSDGHLVWGPANLGLINTQIEDNFAWARQNGIPAEPGVVASGEYSGLRQFPQQPIDNPNLAEAMSVDHINWIAMDASREPAMRFVGQALGVPRHPIDVGYDADTVAEEVNEFNWYNDSKADGGSGICQGSKVTACQKPLTDPQAAWTSVIVPVQAQIVLSAMLNNDPRPFFMHQSNLTADRLAYPVMDAVLSAYRSVYGASAPIVNLPMSGDGQVMRNQQLWGQALRSGQVSAWVEGNTLTIDGAPGTTVPVTVPDGTSAGFGSHYAGETSGFTTVGSHRLKLTLPASPFGQ